MLLPTPPPPFSWSLGLSTKRLYFNSPSICIEGLNYVNQFGNFFLAPPLLEVECPGGGGGCNMFQLHRLTSLHELHACHEVKLKENIFVKGKI